MTLNCLIVDDEPLALDLLEEYIGRTPFLTLAGRSSSGAEALRILGRGGIDLLFLDIQMPHLSGIELSEMIGQRPRVIFTTAFEQYALEGFRVDALDYLLKPISYAEFLRSAGRALQWFEKDEAFRAGRESAVSPSPRSIIVKADYKQLQIALDEILYIEGVGDYVKIHTVDGTRPVITQMSMKTAEERLPADRFVRVHRSYIVNMDQIRTIERGRIVFGKEYIPVSDSYKERFAELLKLRSLG